MGLRVIWRDVVLICNILTRLTAHENIYVLVQYPAVLHAIRYLLPTVYKVNNVLGMFLMLVVLHVQ